ncbi:glycosyltransferase family 2 protein [Candidatus Falkowbacteria bacterium]|uniref:Glycosyltransferase 2-like domain-containing protein n=1 Tax=Candidatus Falkowbacteria bacterium CG10_big_fil_rev_8_21_14_0_10_37_18 TaxID=1974562 RepID=A0A2H0V990_9BACT|nr:glycosyltransferase family 2 protein [Candidatus Falkowbacteria bacterium]NCQ12667.1 glycosyltransferase family 2 protein [Candidatus Falkowbacteria bacterium]OIO06231.1 MAG: hypothetical protein AUJ26_01240 [Candidatus Falkowbacteria bacterium CG1_02_37_21]PIR95643.1 MAG: hypothetical protein COT93_01270 [Candidatus Falkowbacteria bacterium CG10_big_fil_rev_8_21_14_0_10_37_18]
MKLAIGFLTYSKLTARYLPDFLASLELALNFLSPSQHQITVFDNSESGDKQNQQIIESFNRGELGFSPHSPIQYLTQEKNLGFSRAYNILIRSALTTEAEYFLVINPDTLLEPDSISSLLASLENDSGLAATAPTILRWDFAGGKKKTDIIDTLGIAIKPGLQFFDLGQGENVEQFVDATRGSLKKLTILGPSGAAGLFRTKALSDISFVPNGLEAMSPGVERERQYFDENFFMYKEDCDLAYRLTKAGYQSMTVSDSIIYHDRTASSAKLGLGTFMSNRRNKSRQIRVWSFRNQHYLFIKNWKNENIVNRVFIAFRIGLLFIFSLILEQFLLKEYIYIFRYRKTIVKC